MSRTFIIALSLIIAGCGGSGGTEPMAAPVVVAPPTAPPVAEIEPPPPVEPTRDPDADSKVVFIGDSITYFWTDLADLVPGSSNKGVGGQTTPQMLARFDADVLAQHPTVVVIEGGINDLAHTDNPNTDSIAEMANRASAAGAHVYLSAIMPVPPELAQVTLEDIKAFNDSLKMIAGSYGYTYVDYYSAMQIDDKQKPGLFQDTSVHPSEAGYDVMWSVLQPALAPP